MKQHLKFLLLSTLTSIPIVSVVACASSNLTGIADRDVLNSAEGTVMANQTFNMNKNLGLIALPNDGSNYDNLDSNIKNKISEHYSELVKVGNLNWPYETVSVNIHNVKTTYVYNETTGKNDLVTSETAFSTKYGPLVEAKIDLTAELSFKNLTSSVPIVVIINNDNDNATPQAKINAIGNYLTDYLNNRTDPFEFQTLFKNNLSSDDKEAANVYNKIEASLNNTLFNESDPVIDVEGISFRLPPIAKGQNQTIYNLTGTSEITDPDDSTSTIGVIDGILQNLTLQIFNGSYSYNINLSDLTAQNIKIRQRFADADNQIAGILNQGPDSLWFINSDLPNGTLPEPGEKLVDYDGAERTFTSQVAKALFESISSVYPGGTGAIMGEDWTVNAITFPTENQSQFVLVTDPDDPNSDGVNTGYFIVNVEFSCIIGNDTISASVGDLRLNLKTIST